MLPVWLHFLVPKFRMWSQAESSDKCDIHLLCLFYLKGYRPTVSVFQFIKTIASCILIQFYKYLQGEVKCDTLFSVKSRTRNMLVYVYFLGKINFMVVFCKEHIVNFFKNLFPVTHSAMVLELSFNIVPTSSNICEIFLLFLILNLP